MNLRLGSLVGLATLVSTSGAAQAAELPYDLNAEIVLTVEARNSDGSSLPFGVIKEADQDFDTASAGNSTTGKIDTAVATVRASASAASGGPNPIAGTPGEPDLLPPRLIAQVAGSVDMTRPFNVAGGFLGVGAFAKATLQETLTFLTPDNNDPIRVEGTLNLTGNMSLDTQTLGAFMTSIAITNVDVTSNLFSPIHKGLHSVTSVGPDETVRERLRFVLAAIPDVPESVNVSLQVQGFASIGGGTFPVGVGIGLASFDVAFNHTLSWGGITSVTNAITGVPILDWSVNSASGFDYSQSFDLPTAVPLPAAWANLLAGLAMAGWASRRRQAA